MRASFMIVTTLVLAATAQARYSGGSGTADDPYRIATAEDLIALGETPEDYAKHFILTADIDLDPNLPGRKVFDRAVIAPDVNDTDFYYDFQGIPFNGVFNGNSHTISHLTIEGIGNLGLFGQLHEQAVLANVGLVAADVNGVYAVGALAGVNFGGSITDSSSNGSVNGNWFVGGLVGNNSIGSITGSCSTGVVTGKGDVGGLIGNNGDAERGVSILTNCYSTATVRGGHRVGGLAGSNYYKGSISTSYSTGMVTGKTDVGGLVGSNFGDIVMSCSTGRVSADEIVGGLVGYNTHSNITMSHSNGDVSGGDWTAGGLVGWNYNGSIATSYSTGTVTGKWIVGGLVGYNAESSINTSYSSSEVTGYGNIGGLVGYNEDSNITMTYSIGVVTGNENVGGLVGYNWLSSLDVASTTFSFWDIETSGQINSAGGMGKATAEMQIAATFLEAGWDFVDETANGPNDIWRIDEGQDYPRLWWEAGPNTPLVFVDINDPGFRGQMSRYEVTNAQYCDFLNAALAYGDITVNGTKVEGAEGSNGGEDYAGQLYYNSDGSGYTGYGATNGGAARIRYNAGAFVVDDGFGNHPVTYVSWYGAMAFANCYGYYLPAEDQWQAVADYDGTYIYGCGQTIDPGIADYRDSEHPDGTMPVGSFGAYGYGMSDMAGNVWEWTSSSLGSNRVFRGGSLGSIESECAVSIRGDGIPHAAYWDIGFRVCR